MSEALNDTIDNYLKGTLNETDLKAFENALNADASLAKAIDIYKREKEAIELLIEDDTRAKMHVWKREKDAKKTLNTEGVLFAKKNDYYLILGLLMGLLLTVVLYLIKAKKDLNKGLNTPKHNEIRLDTIKKEEKTQPNVLPNSINNTPIVINNKVQKPIINTPKTKAKKEDSYLVLVNAVYDNPDFSEINRTTDLTGDSVRFNGYETLVKAWKNNDFVQVIALSKLINKSDNYYFSSQEIAAHAYFKLNQFVEAESLFNVISQSNKGEISENAQWYRVLCLMALHKNEAATTLLTTFLDNKKHLHHSDAEQLNPLWQNLMRSDSNKQ